MQSAKLKESEMASMDDGCKGEIDLPVVDLSVLNPSDLEEDKPLIMSTSLVEMISKIRDACIETGFFHVINHGFDEEAIKEVDWAARDLFSVPTEAEEKTPSMKALDNYLRRAESPYCESIRFPLSDTVKRVSERLWPDGNPRFCKAIEEYRSRIDAFSKTLMKLILLSLGFDKSSVYFKSLFEKSCDSTIRFSSYIPPTDRQSSAIAMIPHTDLSFITILYHDVVEGLEIQTQKGDWFRVNPVPNSTLTTSSFVVETGDAFQIWSNSRYMSTRHRVVDAGWSSRLTVAYFVYCKDETEMYAPEQLVDEEHPRRYVPFVFKDYKIHKYKAMFTNQNVKEKEIISPFLFRSPTSIPLLS